MQGVMKESKLQWWCLLIPAWCTNTIHQSAIGRTLHPYHWAWASYRASWALGFFFIGYTHVHPLAVKNTWVQVLPRLDWTFENIILVNMSTGSHLYWSCQSFIRNCLERVGLRTVLTPCCVIAFRVLQAVSKPIPKFRGNVIASMPSRCLVTHMLETWTADCISVERVSSHNIREMSSRIELLWLSCSKTCCTFERLWETKHRRWVCCVWSPVCRCRSMLERASH
jgi:hypothetical protein